MCINPSHVWIERGPKWEKTPVGCGHCWRCRKNRVNDYMGRSLCEAATSQAVAVITLTYAPRDDLADKILHPRHFQLFMKLLRRSGHSVRYLVAGEYGDLKGRAHFHAILFFEHLAPRVDYDTVTGEMYERGPSPTYRKGHEIDPLNSGVFCNEIPQSKMVHVREWPHGHVQVDWNCTERSIQYVCKYLLSDDKNRAWFSCSKKPALGSAWFAQKAALAKSLDVLPSTFEYVPPGSTRQTPYLMTGATKRDYLNAITQDPADLPRMSEWVANAFEKYHRQRVEDELNNLPQEEQEAAFNERRERLSDQYAQSKMFDHLRYVDSLSDKLAQSEIGILRRKDGEWQPETERK